MFLNKVNLKKRKKGKEKIIKICLDKLRNI